MNMLGKALLASVVLVVALLWSKLNETAVRPELPPQWWGPGQPQADEAAIRPFTVNVSEQTLQDLGERLKSTPKLSPPLEGTAFQYGFNSKYLEEVLQFWRTKYNWRDREAFLNQFPQFKTKVSGLFIHFLHVRPAQVPRGVTVVPLLLLQHGWPGSVRELYTILPLLTTPRPGVDFVFEVVAPSLPGYGFSDGAAKPGMGKAQVGVILKELMERLGHRTFYVQGGAWGAIIGSDMATIFPERILGYHGNMCLSFMPISILKNFIGSFWPTLFVDQRHVDKVFPYWEKFFGLVLEEMAYFHIHATKPDSVGPAMQDSPAGLAAYILEKFSTWTDPSHKLLPDGGLTRKFTLTDLLDNVMIYWVTGSMTTSMRLYGDYFSKSQMALKLDFVPNYVPTACAQFPNDIFFTPESMLRDKHRRLVRYSVMPRGGHFAAFEEPQLLADDLWDSIQTIRRLPRS